MTHVFIPHSHQDRSWVDRLRAHVRPFPQDVSIDVWDDSSILPAWLRRAEIDRALARADVVVPLVSSSFLSSQAIAEHVLPPLLAKARSGHIVVRPLFVAPSQNERRSSLSSFQPLNSPHQPLVTLSRVQQEEILTNVVREVMRLATLRSPAQPTPHQKDWQDLERSAPARVKRPITLDATDLMQSVDPLAAARRRGTGMRQEILSSEGGTLTAEQLASKLGVSTEDIEERRGARRLIGLEMAQNEYAYPTWQVTKQGMLPGLEAALADLTIRDPWMQAAFFLSGDPRLDGARPLDELRRGNVDAVRRAAGGYGEYGAA